MLEPCRAFTGAEGVGVAIWKGPKIRRVAKLPYMVEEVLGGGASLGLQAKVVPEAKIGISDPLVRREKLPQQPLDTDHLPNEQSMNQPIAEHAHYLVGASEKSKEKEKVRVRGSKALGAYGADAKLHEHRAVERVRDCLPLRNAAAGREGREPKRTTS